MRRRNFISRGEMDEREKLKKKISSITKWQLICLLLGIGLMAWAINYAHNEDVLLAFVSLGSFVLFLVLQFVKFHCRKYPAVLQQPIMVNDGKPPIPPPF